MKELKLKAMINLHKMDLIVNENYSSMTIEVYGRVIQGDRLFIIGYDGERLLEQEVTRENELTPVNTYKPLLIVNRFVFQSLLKAFVEYANGKGVKPEEDSLLKGKMDAMGLHLEDMRELTKKLVNAVIPMYKVTIEK